LIQELKARKLAMLPNEVKIALYQRMDHHVISAQIEKQRSARSGSAGSGSSQAIKCTQCGKELTAKEIKYCKDQEMDYICYFCNTGTQRTNY